MSAVSKKDHIAEHPVAPTAGACMVHREHVEAMWRESLARTSAPVPRPSFEAAETVAVRPLSVYGSLYEEVAE